MHNFSFEIKESSNCPNCGSPLKGKSSILVNDTHWAYVNEFGFLAENDTGACLILSDSSPEIHCANCLGDLSNLFTVDEE